MIYLLGSNDWITLMRGKSAVLAAKYKAMAPWAYIRVCSVVLAELCYGCEKSAKPTANRAKTQAQVAPYPSLPFDDAGADRFGTLRNYLESVGTPIGPDNTQIAAIALANSCTLVTHNTAEFGRVPGLLLEDWQ